MDRRSFVRTAAAGGAALALGRGQAQAPRRPNFLFILTDDQRWDALGALQRQLGEQGRFPWLETPSLDRLLREGVRFENAFVTNSLCSPSRACFLTGRYNHLNGIANNFTEFDTNTPTWATALRAAGYRTGFVGKWHMGSQKGQRPGFDYSASFIGHARYVDAPFEINGETTATKGWVDDVSTGYAEQFIKDAGDRSWALAVCFKTPHGPTEPPARTAAKYPDVGARPVANVGAKPPFPWPTHTPTPRADGTLPVNTNYFRCLTAMDDCVGRLLKLLDDLKLADDTMVVFAGDNGYYFAEHGLGDKRSAYEESLRIPLLLRYPRAGLAGRTLPGLALNIDLAPTWLDYAGVRIPADMQGRSWRPLLEGQTQDWRRSFFFEYFWEPQKGNPTPSLTGVRTERAKLVRYKEHPEWEEVYDLAADPHELKNLARDPAAAALCDELKGEYERQAKAVNWRWPDYASDQRQLAPATAVKGWVLDYRCDQPAGDKLKDATGRGNDPQVHGAASVAGRDGRQALRFDGNAWLDVPKSASLNPGVGAWTVEVVCRADAPDGVLVAHGGETNGYSLGLRGGQPQFVLNAGRVTSRLAATQAVAGRWVTLTARWHDDQAELLVDGQVAASGRLREALDAQPNDNLQIGADLGSPVLAKPLPKFTGLLERVRIFSGVAP